MHKYIPKDIYSWFHTMHLYSDVKYLIFKEMHHVKKHKSKPVHLLKM